MTPEQDRWRAAVHEAGHAVAAAEAQVSINELTLDPWLLHPDQAGRIHHGAHSTPSVLMGGMAAEIAVLGSADHYGISGDREQLARVGFHSGVWRPGWQATFRTIRRHRAAVIAIAKALLKAGTLRPVELYEDILPPFFPEARHPGIASFEPSFSRLAAAWDRTGLGWEE